MGGKGKAQLGAKLCDDEAGALLANRDVGLGSAGRTPASLWYRLVQIV